MAVMEIQCPHCRAKFHLPPDQAGKVVRCGACQELFTTPAVSAKPSAPTPPQTAAPVQTARALPAAQPVPKVRMKVADAEPMPSRESAKASRDSRSTRRVDDDDDFPRTKPRKSKADEKPAFPLIPVLAGGGGLLVLVLVVIVVVLATRSPGTPEVTKNTTPPTVAQPAPVTTTKPAPNPEPTPPPVTATTPPTPPPAITTPPAKVEAPIGDAVANVKNSTVYIRCHSGNMLGMGSGFFAGPDGYIVTNAHVIGYGPERLRNPQKIEIVVNSGEANQTVYKSRIVGVNVEDDLALLWINQQDNNRALPRALSFGKSADLTETQEVLIFGFPLGEQLGLNISVNKSTISSLRKENGVVGVVQVAGGMTNGNSGGPVTNTKGEVIGMSVAVIKGSQINFAIPCDVVARFVEKQLQSGGTFDMGKLAPQFRVMPKR